MKKHSNLSIFISHQGCPCRCSFCNQTKINGNEKPPTFEEVFKTCDEFLPLSGNAQNTEIAFFGGSFTAIEPSYMQGLLEVAYSFVCEKRANGIRISTRPDAITPEILDTLKKYGVTAIELGAQSMDDSILEKNRRGHDVTAVNNAAKLINDYGFELGLQMMTGLYGEHDTMLSSLNTMQKFIDLKPKTVRIYPTLVLKNTFLAELLSKGEYTPPTLDETVKVCAKLIEGFEEQGIKIIRVGLHSDIDHESLLAGPYHPAFKQLCETEIYFKKIEKLLVGKKTGDYTLHIPVGQYSTVAGQKNSTLVEFKKIGYNLKITEDAACVAKNIYLV